MYINEALINPPGTDTGAEMIELRGPAGSVVPANTYLVSIDGDSGDAGQVDNVYNLSGLSFGSNGFMVLRQSGSPYSVNAASSVYTISGTDLENGSMTLLLIRSTVTPAIGNDIDNGGSGVPNAPYTSWTIYDGIGVIDNDNENAYAPINYKEQGVSATVTTGILVDGSAVASEIEYVARAGNTTGSTALDWLGANTAGAVPVLSIEGTRVTQAFYANRAINHWGSLNFP
jgi:hypothetical protein